LGVIAMATGSSPTLIGAPGSLAVTSTGVTVLPVLDGYLQQMIGELTTATATLTEAVRLYQEAGNPLGQATALSYLGLAQRLDRRPAEAMASHSKKRAPWTAAASKSHTLVGPLPASGDICSAWRLHITRETRRAAEGPPCTSGMGRLDDG